MTLGLWAPPWARRAPTPFAPSAGPFTADAPFDPAAWRAEYPNAAFENMRLDDAFWAARRVAAFSDHHLGIIVAKGEYRDPEAAAQLVAALSARRDVIASTWLPAVTPIVTPALSTAGRLTFRNAAVDAGVATAPREYVVQWSVFDNHTRIHTPVGRPMQGASPEIDAPDELLGVGTTAAYVAARVHAAHVDYPHWSRPVTLSFRRHGDGWQAVGLERTLP